MSKNIAITPFQRQVYDAAKMIPEGKITTYKQIANYLQKPGASQAVGNALRHNPFAPVVPCHRVLPSSYKIGGFFGQTSEDSKEVQKKLALLKSQGIEFEDHQVKKSEIYRESITFNFH